jgi:3-methyladenine DNA glycosylase AlkC
VTGLTDALSFSRKKHATVRNESLPCIRPHPWSFELAGVREKQLDYEEVLQATQVLIGHIHRL